MNIMLILVSMCLLCGGIGLFVGVRNAAEERRVAEKKSLGLPHAHVIVLCLFLGCLPLGAQEVVHAKAG